MIECIFTLDYEIYGNGTGSLRDLVYEPSETLRQIFLAHDVRFVPFVEVAELDMLEEHGTDPAIDLVKEQLRQFHAEGFAIGLHLHSQWYNGRYEDGRWTLDFSEHNLCRLPRERIAQIIDRALAYLRRVLGQGDFTPTAFRAGTLVFQPTRVVAEVLAERGITVDSSVFKGGVRREYGIDYRGAMDNGYYWRFSDQADRADWAGAWLEIPIYTQMVPFWKMGTRKRIGLERQSVGHSLFSSEGLRRIRNASRLRHPMKFDFCRMTLPEVSEMIEAVIADDRRSPTTFKPLVAIGHSKELVDFDTISALLDWLAQKRIRVSTFEGIYARCVEPGATAADRVSP